MIKLVVKFRYLDLVRQDDGGILKNLGSSIRRM